MQYVLKTPLSKQDLAPLKAGDTVLLSGVVYTARDAAHARMMELLDKLPQVMVEISDEQVRVLIHYIVNAGDSVSPEFMRALAERLPQHEDKLMTIAERLEQKGRQEGRMEGRMEGALEKALAIACQLQKMGMTPEQIKQATGLSDDELKKITH